MRYRYDDMSCFVSGFDIPVSFGGLFQRITAINNRFYLACFNQLFQKNEIFRLGARCPNDDLLVAFQRSPAPANPL
jgi:hypothetical protein